MQEVQVPCFPIALFFFYLLSFDSKWHLWRMIFKIFFFFSSGAYSSAANSVESFLLWVLDCKFYDKAWIIRLEPLILFSNLSCRDLEAGCEFVDRACFFKQILFGKTFSRFFFLIYGVELITWIKLLVNALITKSS